MRGVYLVAAELSRLGFVVAPTSRGARGADLLVTDEACLSAFTVQVKTKTGGASYWLVGADAKAHSSPSLVYVFVEIGADIGATVSYFVVPSSVVSQSVCDETFRGGSRWYSLERKVAEQFRDRWEIFQSEPIAGAIPEVQEAGDSGRG
jgi:hypothetical protein